MAARNINDVYNFMDYIVRKQRGVFLTIPDAMQALNAGQLDAVEEWFKSYGENQIIHDALRKLRVYQTFTSDTNGVVAFNDDYIHIFGSPFTVIGSTVNTIKFVEEDEWSFAISSKLRTPTDQYPIALDVSAGFNIFPQHIQNGAYWYLRRPATPVLSTTKVGRVISYEPTTSTELEFSDVYINNIIARALFYVGVDMSEQDVTQFAQLYKEETNNG